MAGNVTGVDGPIVITLAWNSGVNLDLSVVEPNGTIVNSTNDNGSSGLLWRYDHDSNEEIYYVPEGRLLPGIYQVFVRYADGNVGTNAQLVAKAGNNYFLR